MGEYVGKRLRITTEEGTYEGIVQYIDAVKQRLTLTQVLSCAHGKSTKRLHGFHNFFGREINNLEILQQDEIPSDGKELAKKVINEKDVNKKRENDFNSVVAPPHHLMEASNEQKREPKITPSSARQPTSEKAAMEVFKNAVKNAGMQMKRTTKSPKIVTRDASDEGSNMLQRPPLAAERYLMDDYYSDEDIDELTPQNPPKTVIIQELSDRFENAVKYINGQRVVGLSCEGIKLGRYGKVCWLVIGCRQFTYLFDVMSLGASCFDEGLGDILVNGNILKVIHDCRQISDALYHQYSIKLVNVFDTQVADIIIYQKEKGGELPRVVNGLVACLYEYLNLSPEECHFQKIRINNMQKDDLIWSRRPLTQQLLDASAKNVMYLRELRLAQMERMLAEFIFGVNIYLGIARDVEDYQLPDKKNKNKVRLVPPQFKELNKFHHRRRNRKFDEDVGDDVDADNQRDINAWQEGQSFTDAYKDKHGQLKERSVEPVSTLPGLIEHTGRGSFKGVSSDPSNIEECLDESPFYDNRPHADQSRMVAFNQNLGPNDRDSFEVNSSDTQNYPRVHSRKENEEQFDEEWFQGQAAGGLRQTFGSQEISTNMRNCNKLMHDSNSRDDKQEDFEDGENAFQFHFNSPEDLSGDPSPEHKSHTTLTSGQRSGRHSLRDKRRQDTSESSVKRFGQLVLNDEDFPPLSSSQSDSSPSTSPTFRPSTGLTADQSKSTNLRESTRTTQSISRGQSSLVRDTVGIVGRGRASLFQHLTNMPHARLPRFDQANEQREARSTYGTGMDVHSFPTDEELFACSEITHVPHSDSVRGGTRVWVRKT